MAEQALLDTAELIDFLERYEDTVLRDSLEGQGMGAALDVLEAESVGLAPVETGELEGSTATRISRQGTKVVGELTFAAPHASRVHELPPDARGPRTRRKPPTRFGDPGPKYLERPLRALTREFGAFIADPIRNGVRGLRIRSRRG